MTSDNTPVIVSANSWHLILHQYIQWSDSCNTDFCVWCIYTVCEVYFSSRFWLARHTISVWL